MIFSENLRGRFQSARVWFDFFARTIVQLGVVAGEAVPRLPGREADTRYRGQDARRLIGPSVSAFDRHLSTRAVGSPRVVRDGARFVDAYVARGRVFVVAHPDRPSWQPPFGHHGRPWGAAGRAIDRNMAIQ